MFNCEWRPGIKRLVNFYDLAFQLPFLRNMYLMQDVQLKHFVFISLDFIVVCSLNIYSIFHIFPILGSPRLPGKV